MSEGGEVGHEMARRKIDESLDILKNLGFPRAQLNERSALTLLALLGLKPAMPWSDAAEPLCGITPMMDFFREHYGKDYKPNTRETVRRQSVHQFLDAGLIVANPDRPERPVNSPKAVYQIETSALKLLRAFGGNAWERDLATYLSSTQTLRERYAQERQMARIPVTLAPGREITLSPGGQNILLKEIIEQFAQRFASPGSFVYVGDTDEKYAYFDEELLAGLGVALDAHGKMPDVIIHHTGNNWLLLIEAVTSHGPISPKRRDELRRLFEGSKAGLVFVTAFLTRKAMLAYFDEISWETEVWGRRESVAHDPLQRQAILGSILIHRACLLHTNPRCLFMQRRPTSQDISWFIDLKRTNQIELNPPYQRRSVWNLPDRRFFLDTIFRGYPSPPIFLHKTMNAEQQAVYSVVDGKQRLQTLFLFTDNEVALADDFGDARFNGRTWENLDIQEKQIFWNYVVPVEFLVFDTNDPQEVNQAFDRLNRNMRKLEPQELRHARWDGWFIKLVENEAEDGAWQRLGVVTKARTTRMKDAQFLTELVLVLIENKVVGFDQQHLDAAYAKYDEPDETDEPLDTDEVMLRLAESKQYLLEMQDHNGCVKRVAGNLGVFYTLWAAVSLHSGSLPEPGQFADRFAAFKQLVDTFNESDDKASLLKGDEGAKYKLAEYFLQGYRANTDLAPRLKRLQALMAFVQGGES